MATGEAGRAALGSSGENRPGLFCSNTPVLRLHRATAPLRKRAGFNLTVIYQGCVRVCVCLNKWEGQQEPQNSHTEGPMDVFKI